MIERTNLRKVKPTIIVQCNHRGTERQHYQAGIKLCVGGQKTPEETISNLMDLLKLFGMSGNISDYVVEYVNMSVQSPSQGPSIKELKEKIR